MNEYLNPTDTIPEFDRRKLVEFLRSGSFQSPLNDIIARTRKSGLEQALTVMANAKSGRLFAKEATEVDYNGVRRGFTEAIEGGFRPLVTVHTHAATTKLDLTGEHKYFKGVYFLPSPTDMEIRHVYDEEGKQFINLVAALIVTTSTPRIWIWQVPGKRAQKIAAKTVKDYSDYISRDITDSDIAELADELRRAGLKLYYGSLSRENPAKSFVDIFSAGAFSTGYLY